MLGFKLLVIIVFNPVGLPLYKLRCPKKIFALGKLNNKNDNKTIICEINKIENSRF